MLSIAKRIYQGCSNSSASASAIRIAVAGIAVGILVMIVSISVTHGFQQEIKNKVSSLVGYLQLVNSHSLYRPDPLPIEIPDSLVDLISSNPLVGKVHRFVISPGMLKTQTTFNGVFFRGVDSTFHTSFVSSCLVSGTLPTYKSSSPPSDTIVIPSSLASSMQVDVGDRIYAYFFDNNLRARRFYVSGIFQTHMSEFDKKMCYADARVIQQLSGLQSNQYSGVEILLNDPSDLDHAQSLLNPIFTERRDSNLQPYSLSRVDELYPQIFSWLTLLDTNVIAILVLMVCVACVTMVSGLLIIILEQTPFIGIMKSMGATNTQLRRLFLHLSVMIVVKGLLWGNIISFALLLLQRLTGFITLDPSSYYLSKVPVTFPWGAIVLLNIITLVLCVLVLVVPTHIISKIHPAKSIRFE